MAHQLTWLADVLRAAGLPVREIPGWQQRGHGAMADALAGVLCHHTAGSASGLYPSEKVVVQGRTGLAGPLANLGLDRAGTWIVVSAGQAWHAGSGSMPWCPAGQGNSRLVGVEAESVGTRDDWTPAQRSNYPRGVAALLRHLGLPASRAIGHKEWAPGRKIDPAFWDMNAFRADVARWLTTTTEDDMFTDADRALLHSLARRVDIGYARDQILTALDVADPQTAPGVLPPGQTAPLPARVDALRAALDALMTRVVSGAPTAGPAVLSEADLDRIAARVVALLGRKTSAP